VVVGQAGGARALERFAVGVGDHQDFPRQTALSDDGDESIVPEVHGLNPIFCRHKAKITGRRVHCQKAGA